MRNQQGYIALLTTLIVLAMALVTVGAVSLLSIGEAESGLALSKGEETLQFVEGCMEDAILQVKTNQNYSGGTIIHPEGNCVIQVDKSGSTYTITSTTDSSAQYQRVIQVVVNRANTISLISWKEI